MTKNRFSKAIRHLKSTEVDDRLKSLEESAPTNSISGVYAKNAPGFRYGKKDPEKVFYPDLDGNWPAGVPGTPGQYKYVRPAGYWDEGPGTVPSVDWEVLYDADYSYDTTIENNRNTDTIIDKDTGFVKTALPPNSRSFILGPMVDSYVHVHGYDNVTRVGYIQKDTREFVLLASFPGTWGDDNDGNPIPADGFESSSRVWDGQESSVTIYNDNFTYEMFQWFHNKLKESKYTKNVAFYLSGGVGCIIGGGGDGQPEGSTQGNSAGGGGGPWPKDAGDNGDGGQGGGGPNDQDPPPNEGTPQDEPQSDDPPTPPLPLPPERRRKRPGEPGYDPEVDGDDRNWNPDGTPRNTPKDKTPDKKKWTDDNIPDGPLDIDDFEKASDYSAYKAGGGDAARAQGKSLEDIIAQGRKNIDAYDGQRNDPRTSIDPDYNRNYELSQLMNKPPGSHTPAERQQLIDAGLDDFARGNMKSTDPVGDLLTLGAAAAAVKVGLVVAGSAITQGIVHAARATLSTLGTVKTADVIADAITSTAFDAGDSGDYNAQLATKLPISILTGVPQEIKLNPNAKREQINSVDPNQFSELLTVGGQSPRPSANSTVNPKNKGPLLTGGWGAQGGSEVHYDPKTDTLTITSEKMLRTGQPGDEFDGNRQTKFGDIPSPPDDIVAQKVGEILDIPGVKEVPAILGSPEYQRILKEPGYLENEVLPRVARQANSLATSGVQGTASNIVATREALTKLGLLPKSEIEKTGGGYGQVFSQTEYTGNEIPQELKDIIKKKTNLGESYVLTESRKRILREIKQPYKMKETPKQKYKMNFKGKFRPQNTPDVTASKQSDDSVKAKNAAGQTWRTKDKYWGGYESQERMNVVYDNVGHGQMYWDYIVNENQSKKGVRDRQIQEHLNVIAHEKAMKKLDSAYTSPFGKKIEEQETLQADNDPLFKRVSKDLKKKIDYSDKPAKAGYPNDPPPKMVNGYHPELGQKGSYYNKLDPQSANAMPKTGNPEIDAKVQKAKRLKKILGKRG